MIKSLLLLIFLFCPPFVVAGNNTPVGFLIPFSVNEPDGYHSFANQIVGLREIDLGRRHHLEMLVDALNQQEFVTLRQYDPKEDRFIKTQQNASIANSNLRIVISESDVADVRLIVYNIAPPLRPMPVAGNLALIVQQILPENMARVNACLQNGAKGYDSFELIFSPQDGGSVLAKVYPVPDNKHKWINLEPFENVIDE